MATAPGEAAGGDLPRALCDVHAALADSASAPTGVVWRMTEVGRQLDANLLNLPAGQVIGTHAEPDLDVLVIVVAGSGTMSTDEGPLTLGPGRLVWLPHSSTRSLTAGPDGLAYLTVHRRRPGMQIRSGPPAHGPYAVSS
ncbi:cupin domain-containing protein [Pseudonocardia asaccharolytica]|uniref:AraC-type arabinose-binding/dimerisation domain-containing protein n=1 Tax=Pseudonocardia asaccharolytica DSM 44247 = NBRC 16224 TaxID=1123024 RepID=A0A511CYD7_9PSEU|nr:hypothetical protein [Pseudonocardia asaccharolytica]GEL17576.1 hypothetical protein PA7_14130 [Pseudonocardia asaccharolytica DSM 44247 = NBRC 16224]